MSRKLLFCSSFFAAITTSTILCAQPVAPPPKPPARDREPHYISKPQDVFPRTNHPNLDLLGDHAVRPVSQAEIDDATPEKPSEIRSTVSGPREAKARTTRVEVEARGVPRDSVLATFIAISTQEEILLSEFASERAMNPNVRKFATQMALEHRAFLDKLQRFAPEAVKTDYLEAVVLPSRSDLEVDPIVKKTVVVETPVKTTVTTKKITETPRKTIVETVETPVVETDEFKTTVELPTKPRVQRVSALISVPQVVAIERELAAQCLATQKQMLSLKSGSDFDTAFVARQLTMHMAMKNKLATYQRHVSSGLDTILTEGQIQTDRHLTQAFELMRSLDSLSKTGVKPDEKISTGVSKSVE